MDNIKLAYQMAVDVRKKAYAPYSQFKVGAALKLKNSDEIIVGCNVENASLGATICAERGALMQLSAKHGKSDIEFMVVVTDVKTASAPCGVCRQFLSEFCGDDFPIYLGNLKGVQKNISLGELLPYRFDKIHDLED